MTEPSPSRPVPGPFEPGLPAAPGRPVPYAERSYADLDQRPVAEHVEVFEAEHARLQHELSTIDRL
jgi:hypothetical protein